MSGIFSNPKKTPGLSEIKKRVRHRFPFLMIDRILELEEGVSCVALKNITYNELILQGHFPQNPVFPGVMIIEAMAQTGGIAGYTLYKNPEKESAVFTGFDKVKFRKPVFPGDQLILKAEIIRRRMNLWRIKGEAFVNDNLVAEAELRLAVVSMN